MSHVKRSLLLLKATLKKYILKATLKKKKIKGYFKINRVFPSIKTISKVKRFGISLLYIQ